jgi:hypothetical protein
MQCPGSLVTGPVRRIGSDRPSERGIGSNAFEYEQRGEGRFVRGPVDARRQSADNYDAVLDKALGEKHELVAGPETRPVQNRPPIPDARGGAGRGCQPERVATARISTRRHSERR